MLLVYLGTAWLVGILLGSKFNLPVWALFLSLLPLTVILLFRHHKKLLLSISLCLLALFGGIIRYQANLPVISESNVQFYNDRDSVNIKGVIFSDPDVRDRNTQVYLAVKEIKTDGDWQNGSGKLLLFASRYPEYHYGDMLTVTGKLQTPQVLGEFDYPNYLANQGIYSTMSYPRIELVEQGNGFKPLQWVYKVRRLLAQKMAEVLPEPQAALAQGIILGVRSNIPQSVKDDFTLTGTTHVLAISGMNLNIIAGMLVAAFLWRFGKKHYLYVWLTLAVIWVYTLLTGMNAPVVRSAIMLSLFLIADVLGRQRSVMPALAFAGGVMVAITPRILWDASFQLSFLAVLALAIVAPPLQSIGRKIVTKTLGEDGTLPSIINWLNDSLAVTLGVTIVVWPVIAYYFGVFSFVTPIATLLIVPALTPIIVTGVLAAGLGIIAIPVGQVVGWLAWLFLSYMLVVIKWFADLPSAAIRTGRIDPFIIAGYFVVIATILLIFKHRNLFSGLISTTNRFFIKLPKKWVVPPLLAIAVMATVFAGSMPDDRLHVSFLDVGQGDAILIQTPAHQDILVDGGPSPQALNLELGRRLPFWDRTIELVVLTHSHADHLTGLLDVLRRYKVKQVLYPETDSKSPLWLEWCNLIQEKGIKTTVATAGQIIDLGDDNTRIEIFNPLPESDKSVQDNGVVMKMSDGSISFLLAADIPAQTELDLLTSGANLTSTVLKVSHHGSDSSSSPEFLMVVNPSLAVISVGLDNDYGHPSKVTMETLSERMAPDNIYRTDKSGTIEFITDGNRLWVEKDR